MECRKIMKIKHNQIVPLRWCSEVIGKRKIYILGLLILQILLGGSSILYAMLLRNLIDAAVEKNVPVFKSNVVYFFVLLIFQIVISALGRYLAEQSRSSMENRFKQRLFNCLLKKDYYSVKSVHTGEWMNRLTSDTVIVANSLTQIVPNICGMTVRLIGALGAIVLLNASFAIIIFPAGLLVLLMTHRFRGVLKKLHKKIQEKDGRVRVLLQESLSSMLVIRAFGREKQIELSTDQAMREHKKARMKRNHFSNLFNTGFGAAMNGMYAVGAAFCGYGLLKGSMSYGTMTAILQLISQVQSPFANLTGYLPQYYSMLASAERLMEAEAFADDGKEAISDEEIQKFYKEDFLSLGMKNASFTYDSIEQDSKDSAQSVLENVDMEIRKGEFIAFHGPSGCGKSTVLRLLMCLYPLDSGELFIESTGGTIPLTSSYRGMFAYVPQGNQLMSGSIREIVAFGDTDKMQDEDKIWRALKIACADQFVHSLEKGLDTVLGEGGSGLSEGQMQRIAVARALFSDRPILLLDESTSALDEQTERELLENLRSMTDKTVLIVTHRMAAKDVCVRQFVFSEDGIQTAGGRKYV